MRAMAMKRVAAIEEGPLEAVDYTEPEAGSGEVLIKVLACGVCHTELDQIEGRIEPSVLPVIPGHQIVGRVVGRGNGANRFEAGDLVGLTWLYSSCGCCEFCRTGNENLCDNARWTGHDVNGGYAEYAVADEKFVHPIPGYYSAMTAAPLLCAGIIGYRALRISGVTNGQTIGLFGFGASAHILLQVIRHKFPDSSVFVFTRSEAHQEHAVSLGAMWAGGTEDLPPAKLDKAIDFTPVGETVKSALSVSKKGARVVINAIRKITPIPQMDYAEYLWGERQVMSVANVTMQDGREFLPLAAEIGIEPEIEEFGLEEANKALQKLKKGHVHGAAVLHIGE